MRDPITLANAVLPGAGYVHLNRPVPTPCRITLSPGTPHAETVPAYLCSDDAVPVLQLGYGQPRDARVVLARAHAAGSPVRVEDAMADEQQSEITDTAAEVAPTGCYQHASGTFIHVAGHPNCPAYLRGAKPNRRRMRP